MCEHWPELKVFWIFCIFLTYSTVYDCYRYSIHCWHAELYFGHSRIYLRMFQYLIVWPQFCTSNELNYGNNDLLFLRDLLKLLNLAWPVVCREQRWITSMEDQAVTISNSQIVPSIVICQIWSKECAVLCDKRSVNQIAKQNFQL